MLVLFVAICSFFRGGCSTTKQRTILFGDQLQYRARRRSTCCIDPLNHRCSSSTSPDHATPQSSCAAPILRFTRALCFAASVSLTRDVMPNFVRPSNSIVVRDIGINICHLPSTSLSAPHHACECNQPSCNDGHGLLLCLVISKPFSQTVHGASISWFRLDRFDTTSIVAKA